MRRPEVKWAVQAHSLTSRWTEVAISPENGRFVASVNGVSGAVHRVGGATHDGSGAFRTQDCHRGRRRRGDRVGLSDTVELLRWIPADHTYRVITVSFSPSDNSRLVSGGADNEICVWDVDIPGLDISPRGEKTRTIEGRSFVAHLTGAVATDSNWGFGQVEASFSGRAVAISNKTRNQKGNISKGAEYCD